MYHLLFVVLGFPAFPASCSNSQEKIQDIPRLELSFEISNSTKSCQIIIMFLLQFTWLDGDGTTIAEGITSDTEEIENTKRITAISTLKLTVKKTHHNKSITCQAQNPAESSPASVSIKLMVEYAPHVTISVDHSPVKEGESVTFTCNAHANPSEGMVYRLDFL